MKVDFFQGIKAKQWAILGAISIAVIYFAVKIFMQFTFVPMNSDVPSHCYFAVVADADWHLYPANFGLYFAVNVIRHILPELEYMHGQMYAMVILLSLSVGIKWLLSTLFIRQIFMNKGLTVPLSVSITLGVLLLSVFAIPYRYIAGDNFYYIGSFVPVVWHNSTIIASIPFSILLFWLSAKELECPNRKRVAWICLVVFLLVCIKPSYIFAYSLGFPLLFLIRYGLKVKYWIHYLPVALSGIFVILQWWLLFVLNTCSFDNSTVVFSPFLYWESISTISKLPLALSASVLAPILALFAIEKQKDWTALYATVILAVSIMMYLCISEGGARFNAGNFYWQVVPATYIFFLVSLPSLVSGYMNFSASSVTKRIIVVVTTLLYIAHVASGAYYIKFIFDTNNYL